LKRDKHQYRILILKRGYDRTEQTDKSKTCCCDIGSNLCCNTYEIVKIISSNAVKLKLPVSFKIHNVINVSRIHPYHPLVAGQSIIPPKPVTVEGTPEYEVEEIMDSRLKRDKLEFLVK